MEKFSLEALLKGLTSAQKAELAEFGISAARRSDWLHGSRKPTAAQMLTLASVLNLDPGPLLLWHAKQDATPAQLDLFLRALGKATAAVAVVILSGAGNHADAASMRVGGLTGELSVPHIMRSLWLRLAARSRRLVAVLKAPSWGLFFAWPTTDNKPC